MGGGRFSLIYLLTIFIDVYSIGSFLPQYLKPEGGIFQKCLRFGIRELSYYFFIKYQNLEYYRIYFLIKKTKNSPQKLQNSLKSWS